MNATTIRNPAGPVLFALFALLALLVTATPAAAAGGPIPEVLLEAGAVVPLGDLGDDYEEPLGFGAGLGYQVGFRLRLQYASGWAVAPSFHYVKPRTRTGNDAVLGEIETATSMYRYGVDAQYRLPARPGAPSLFLTGGLAVVRDRLREDDREGQYFAESCNALAAAAGVGVRRDRLEITVQYEVNRFTTNRFWSSQNTGYNWDTISVRVGLALPQSFN
ncbi:MAG: outer membrane beta-barrel protein [Candidatus Latescibacteria bacterium]|nr:outer membrane beta-barrel protein [Candidatus Latescibacterota bacterium]